MFVCINNHFYPMNKIGKKTKNFLLFFYNSCAIHCTTIIPLRTSFSSFVDLETIFKYLCIYLFFFIFIICKIKQQGFLEIQTVKNLPAIWETWVSSLGWEDSPEKRMATHSSNLPWRIPWAEQPGRLQSTGSQRVGQD